jgi:hypothetical protein
VRLSQAGLRRYSQYSVQLVELSLAHIEVRLPSWRARCAVHMRGVSAEIRQRQMPEVQRLGFMHAWCRWASLPPAL